MLAGRSGHRSSAAPGPDRCGRDRSSPAARERGRPGASRDRDPGAPPGLGLLDATAPDLDPDAGPDRAAPRGPAPGLAEVARRAGGCSPRCRPLVPSEPGWVTGRSRPARLPFSAASRVRDEPLGARTGLPRPSFAPVPGPPRGPAGRRSRPAVSARPPPPERPSVLPGRPPPRPGRLLPPERLSLPPGRSLPPSGRPLPPSGRPRPPPERPLPPSGRPRPPPERPLPPSGRPRPPPERPLPRPEPAAPVPAARRAPGLPAPPWPARPFWPAPELDARCPAPAWGGEPPSRRPRSFPTTVSSQPKLAMRGNAGASTVNRYEHTIFPTRGRRAEGRYQHGSGPQHEDVRRRPTLPRGPPRSTIGAEELNFRVRNGTGCFPFAMATETLWRCQVITDRTSGTAQWTHAKSVSRSQATRPISTGQLHTSPCFHFRPINPVV